MTTCLDEWYSREAWMPGKFAHISQDPQARIYTVEIFTTGEGKLIDQQGCEFARCLNFTSTTIEPQ